MPNEDQFSEALRELRPPPPSWERRRRLREQILARAEALLSRRRRRTSHWEVLAGWARPGLVAAAILLALVTAAGQIGGSGGERPVAPVALDELLRQTAEHDSVPAMLLTSSEPDADAVVAAVFAGNTGPPPGGN